MLPLLPLLWYFIHTCKRPTRAIYKYIRIQKSKNYNITKFTKFPKIVKCELCNLYIIQNKNLDFFIFENDPKVRKYFGIWGVFVKEIVICNIGFGFCVLNCILDIG